METTGIARPGGWDPGPLENPKSDHVRSDLQSGSKMQPGPLRTVPKRPRNAGKPQGFELGWPDARKYMP